MASKAKKMARTLDKWQTAARDPRVIEIGRRVEAAEELSEELTAFVMQKATFVRRGFGFWASPFCYISTMEPQSLREPSWVVWGSPEAGIFSCLSGA